MNNKENKQPIRMLKCVRCHKEQKEINFPIQKDKKWGRGSWCYECKRKVEKERYAQRSEQQNKVV